MLNENLLVCMEQKAILLTHILDITKEIQVRCKQEELVFDNLFEDRQAYIDRVAKCNKLIENILEACEPKEKAHLEQILEADANAKATGSEENRLLQYSITANKHLHKILSIHKATLCKLHQEHEELQELLGKEQKNSAVLENFK